MKELEKTYSPAAVEDRIYADWEQKGYFHATPNPDKKPYAMVIPPPNITGQFHMGHALNNTMQDIIIRHKRMQGFETLWMPGTDHASIATEAKIVEAMAKEGLTKEGIGREAFLERAWDWRAQYGGRIVQQLKKLGSSLDWERERFTLDEGCSKAVNEVFVRLYEKGLIYRGERIINWCPVCKTSISEAEVEYSEQEGHFWHLRYPFTDGSGYLELATTRPETLLGDTAVAVNPKDERYKHMVGKMLTLPLVGRQIPVVADDYVDMEFGTGVVKITPAHDPNDFEVGLRHNLEVINVLNEDATINELGGKYAGMDRYAARKAIVADLEAEGFLVRTQPHTHNVGSCYRCSTTVEPRVSKQWFVKMGPLAEDAIACVKDGRVNFTPKRFEKTYLNWMENIRDWCISRQLWWGHQIPAWYCADCGEITVCKDEPGQCKHCHSKNITRDEDTLDTWFSSALWPFSTLGWPDQTPELEYFYPTNTLVTAYDIIFFWVARMIFSGLAYTDKAPFQDVVIHGIVRDAQGRKMSKSLGNGIDPLEEIEKYGADALRYALIAGTSTGGDMRYSEEKITAARNFANKLWNASRFVLMNLDDSVTAATLPDQLEMEDKWLLYHLNKATGEINENLEKFELGLAAVKVQDLIWDVFCDWYIELAKARLQAGGETAARVRQVLAFGLNQILRLLHPFMPFITEELYQAAPHACETIMLDAYPAFDAALDFVKEGAEFDQIIDVIRTVRNRRNELNVPFSKKSSLFIETDHQAVLEQGNAFYQRLAGADAVTFGKDFNSEGMVALVTDCAKIFIPLAQLVDLEKELARLEKELAATEKEIASLNGKLSNQAFVAKAPEKVVQAERDKLAAAQARLEKLEESIALYRK